MNESREMLPRGRVAVVLWLDVKSEHPTKSPAQLVDEMFESVAGSNAPYIVASKGFMCREGYDTEVSHDLEDYQILRERRHG